MAGEVSTGGGGVATSICHVIPSDGPVIPPFWGGYLGFVIDDIQEARRGSRGFPLADNDKEGDAT